MKEKRNNKGFTVGIIVLMVVAIFLAVMTVNYPFSHFSLKKGYTFKPNLVLYNGKTYEEKVETFKRDYLKKLDVELTKEPEKRNQTIVRIEYVFNLFEQDWLIDTEAVLVNKAKLADIHFYVEQWRNTLLKLLEEVDYTKVERENLVNTIQRLLNIEKSVIELQTEKYFSKQELNNLLGNLQGELQSEFEIFVSTFYEQTK